MSSSAAAVTAASSEGRRWPGYRAVWRWHFYAGLICIPFVIWLSVTGSIYLFKPQIEAWLDRPYEGLNVQGGALAPSMIVGSALKAVPGGVLNAYELPPTPLSAVRVLVGRGGDLYRVYVHPGSGQVLHVVEEDRRFMRLIFSLHGELMQGDRGSMIVETAASWTIVMLVTGLYLWWPRGNAGLAGVVYPRLRGGSRVFWRDLHAVLGLWVSFFALFLLVSGLPWAKSWGGMLKSVRQMSSVSSVRQDWTTGRSSELAERALANAPEAGEHAGHGMHGGGEHQAHGEHGGHEGQLGESAAGSARHDYRALDRLVPMVAEEHLAAPVLIAPPSRASASWVARSDSQNRPLRATVSLDGADARVLSRENFSQRPMMDRVVGVGAAAHEGQLFAPVNQLLGLFTALGLLTLSISAVVLWWRRRPAGALGAPMPLARPRLAVGVFLLIGALGIVLPLFGATLLIVLLLEKFMLRRRASVREFLNLAST